MTVRLLPPGEHGYDAVRRADRIETAEAEVTAGMIDRFADLTGDRFLIHMSDAGAATLGFPGRVVHGLLVLSVIDGLKNQTPAQFAAIASLKWEWSFLRPVLAGDRIRASFTVRSRRATSDGARGILRLAVEVRNQRDEVVQQGHNLLMVRR